MKVYVPFTNFEPNHPLHDCKEIETEKAVYKKSTMYSDSIIYNGMIYNGDVILKNPEGVEAYWIGDMQTMYENEIKADKIKWKVYTA